ncbi:hypothetical protein BDV95DRAFT_63525 [Massariosphaeria phaeospora]|uniref:Uncharacterized protein n=1 Tax=Massariosphaeria phaeospora TaxID=100035 RepID=A0A7C8MMH9_9PLEO|nr:hypothetical protein BDV95DRAFT_63525 [Massariosphaeria phaeospora]
MKLFRLGITGLVFLSPACCDLLPRAIWSRVTDDVWDNAVCKGGNLLTAMKSSDKAAAELISKSPGLKTAASPFQDIAKDLEEWGWRTNDDLGVELTDLRIPEFIEGAKLNVNNVKYATIEHTVDYKKDGHDYKATQGFARFITESSGVIFALWLESPYKAARKAWKKEPAIDELPRLQMSSDLLWAAYEPYSGSRLRHVMSCDINNEETRAIMFRALGNKAPTTWPGTSFDINSDEGLALLGSPNGYGFAYLLIQRKAELGNRCITRATVFRPPVIRAREPDPMLLFDVRECQVEFE